MAGGSLENHTCESTVDPITAFCLLLIRVLTALQCCFETEQVFSLVLLVWEGSWYYQEKKGTPESDQELL